MDKNFLLLKLNRVVWVAFLLQEKIEEAIRYFEMYIVNLESIQNHARIKKDVKQEITSSIELFLNKILSLAEKFYGQEDWANAVISYAAYFKYSQEDITVNKNFMDCLDRLSLYDLETDVLLYISSLNFSDPAMYRSIAELYAKRKNNYKSVEYINKYIENNKENLSAQDYNLKGCYYNCLFSEDTQDINDARISLEAFEKASNMVPSARLYAKNATIMASKCGDIESGAKAWERVLATNSLTNDDKYDYAAFCLKTGDFEGWHNYFDARFNKENNATQFPKISKPKWDGVKDLSDSTLLVRFEQGYGDSFLMYGYLPRLAKLAKHVIFIVQDSIYPLVKDNEYGIEVIPADQVVDIKKIKFDYYIPSMSIPIVMKMTRENISVGEGYIKADETLVKEFKDKYFNNDKFKIGLSISGNASGDKSRDIDVESLASLDTLNGVKLYSLTKGVSDEKYSSFKHNKVENIGNLFDNFSQTAAAIENCDLVLTTDNCILNLAGALGKKTFALFNNPNQFRWFDLSGEDVIWFTCVKPFVNDEYNEWSTSVNKAVEEIKKLI